jgi:DNA-binding NarL/FixJ family response regulator
MIDHAPGAKRFNVLVALDNEVARRGLATMLGGLPMWSNLVGCVDVAQGSMLLCNKPEIDLVIVSPEQDCRPLKEAAANRDRCALKVLALLYEYNQKNLQDLASCPFDGFLLESDLTTESLRHMFATLSRGEMPMPAALAHEMLVHVRRRTLLTPREKIVLDLLTEGLSNKQIARRLEISNHGAKRHVANVLAKLNCANRTSAVVKAIGMGLVASPDRQSTTHALG